MPRHTQFLFLLPLAFSLIFLTGVQSQPPDPEPNETTAGQSRLVVFESFLRYT